MTHWEEEKIIKDRARELIFYKRFIDDLMLIWKGDITTFKSFMDEINMNNKNIRLTWTTNYYSINFLDLEIFKEGRLYTWNYFEPTDRNAYLFLDSCHHKSGLFNIPKGQFVRICRTFSRETDYLQQAEILANRFVQKGYQAETIEVEKN